MANTKQVLSIVATTSERISDLVIKNGQLIFVHDVGRLALDYNGKRTFYNQIIELDREYERANLSAPANGKFYFIIETAILWRYFNGWQQITTAPEDIVFIGEELPALGVPNKLYVNTTENNESISVWDDESDTYKVVADKTQTIEISEIVYLFNK